MSLTIFCLVVAVTVHAVQKRVAETAAFLRPLRPHRSLRGHHHGPSGMSFLSATHGIEGGRD